MCIQLLYQQDTNTAHPHFHSHLHVVKTKSPCRLTSCKALSYLVDEEAVEVKLKALKNYNAKYDPRNSMRVKPFACSIELEA